MYEIKKGKLGEYVVYNLTFDGYMNPTEMQAWFTEAKHELLSSPKEFVVKVDMRRLSPLCPESQIIMQKAQKFYRDSGMDRSAVLLNNDLLRFQFEQIARNSGIFEWERYYSNSDPDSDEAMNDWLVDSKFVSAS